MTDTDLTEAREIRITGLDWIWVAKTIVNMVGLAFGLGVAFNVAAALIVSAVWIIQLAEWGALGRWMS